MSTPFGILIQRALRRSGNYSRFRRTRLFGYFLILSEEELLEDVYSGACTAGQWHYLVRNLVHKSRFERRV